VANQCDHCGKILPNDTIRYCPDCGKRIASSRPAKRSLSEDPPAWMKQLEVSLTNNRSKVPLRELNVKVWDDEETIELTLPEKTVDTAEDEQDVVDGLPTSPLMVASSPITNAPSQTHSCLPGVEIDEEDVAEEDVTEELPTNPHMAGLPQNTLITPVSLPLIQSQVPPGQPFRQTPPGLMPVPPLARSKKNKRKRLVFVFGLLLFLLLGGVIAWVIIDQPFAVPEITKTTLNFNNTSLGVSLQYPQSWAIDVNKQNGTVSFYDDNHTDQVNITVVQADNQSMNQYMTKTVSSLGMTGQKTQAELSFAGTAWQQIQGSVQQSGANYTAVLLITIHRQRYYTILQLAPSSTYPLEEQLVFSQMRSSFQF